MFLRMDIIESLSKKVHQAARELTDLKKERHQLLSELEALRRQARGHQHLMRENQKMRQEQDQLRTRLIRLQKKIDKHLLVETTLAAGSAGGNHEEYS